MSIEFGLFVAVGFLAQLVDGALGMAFGIIVSTCLIASGTPPSLASAAVHAAEIVTTGVSGASHIYHRNVDWTLFRRLVFPGVIGGAIGTYLLTGLPKEVVKPVVTVYLALMAIVILARAFAYLTRRWNAPIPLVGAGGAFLDAIGGGGWGPIVSSTLLAAGDQPRERSARSTRPNSSLRPITFLTQLELDHYVHVVLGLIVGGGLAAPLAGYLIKVLPMRYVLMLVGAVLSALTVVNLIEVFA